MKKNAIEKTVSAPLKEKGQYVLIFSLIALMLYAAGFPMFLLFFVGVLTFFIWKVFSSESRNETRRIFEFYLSANEILRKDDRRWYGFEIQETIGRGEAILRSMSATPPLVHFALGALYQKMDDHSSAIKHLSQVVAECSSDESAIVFPAKDLRDYVQMLRKIERAPAEAPLTSAAVRSLERVRKNKGKELLESSRSQLAGLASQLSQGQQKADPIVEIGAYGETEGAKISVSAVFHENADPPRDRPLRFVSVVAKKGKREASQKSNRKSISEVLHDIYDRNSQ